MASQLRDSGAWQGSAIIPASEVLAFFAFISATGENYETWTEPVLAWVMGQERRDSNELNTRIYGMALLQVGGTEVYRRPDICEERHDERGCLIGYVRGTLTETDMPAWNKAAREHLKQCQSRRAAIGG